MKAVDRSLLTHCLFFWHFGHLLMDLWGDFFCCHCRVCTIFMLRNDPGIFVFQDPPPKKKKKDKFLGEATKLNEFSQISLGMTSGS